MTRSVAATAYGCTVPVIDQIGAWAGTLFMTQANAVRYGSGCTEPPFDSIEMLSDGTQRSSTLDTPASAGAILVDETHICSGGPQVYAITAPGQYHEIYSEPAQPSDVRWSLAVDDQHVYITTTSNVVKVDKSGGAAAVVVAAAASAIAVDATTIRKLVFIMAHDRRRR